VFALKSILLYNIYILLIKRGKNGY